MPVMRIARVSGVVEAPNMGLTALVKIIECCFVFKKNMTQRKILGNILHFIRISDAGHSPDIDIRTLVR